MTKALLEAGVGKDNLKETFARTVNGACVQCGIRLQGAELFPLAILGDEESGSSPRVARLRQGYCGRRGCTSYYYRIELAPYPGIDWAKVRAPLDSTVPDQPVDAPVPAYRYLLSLIAWRPWAWKALAGAVLVAVLLVIRQWYVGGTIPVVRQPEKFVVDPGPAPAGGPR